MNFIKQYESSSDNEEEPQQQEAPFCFSSKSFYTTTTVAPNDISLSTVQHEASENGHNEERSNSRVSYISDIDIVDYVGQDKLESIVNDDPYIDSDIESEGSSLYGPSQDKLDNIGHDDTYPDSDNSFESEGSLYVPSAKDENMAYYSDISDEESKQQQKKF